MLFKTACNINIFLYKYDYEILKNDIIYTIPYMINKLQIYFASFCDKWQDFDFANSSYLRYNNNYITRWHDNGITINVFLEIFIYRRMISRFSSCARSVLAMDAENMQLYEATLALAAWNKIYESLRFLKNWWQRSILLAKCNIEVLKSVWDGNVTSPRKQQQNSVSQLEKITSYLKHARVVISDNDNINFLMTCNENGI